MQVSVVGENADARSTMTHNFQTYSLISLSQFDIAIGLVSLSDLVGQFRAWRSLLEFGHTISVAVGPPEEL
jgi:hypothetical protein